MTFKKLFEVRLLHDYYLTLSDGTSYYSLLNQQDQEDLLNKRLSYRQYHLMDDLNIEPTEACLETLKNHRLKFLPTGLGFVVVAAVKVRTSNNGDEVYQPIMQLKEDFNLGFRIVVKNPLLKNFTALSFNRSFPFQYYFNNKNEGNDKQFPALSLPVSAFENGQTYQMGDIALIGNTQKQALLNTQSNNTNEWQDLEGQGLVHQGDRLLLPKRFTYQFDNESVLSAEFTLQSLAGTVIKKITSPPNNTRAFTQMSLDFNRQGMVPPAATGQAIPDGWYRLSISTNNGTSINQLVLLHDELYRGKSLGAIKISNEVTDADFRISQADGTLRTKILANGQIVHHPIFEIRWRSRATYWRYKKATDFDLVDVALTAPFLDVENRDLVTKTPVSLSSQLIHFQNNANPIPLKLPNPSASAIQPEANGKIYSNVYISKINLLTTS